MVQQLHTSIVLPDLNAFVGIPPNCGVNPHHDVACAESREWFAQYNKAIFGPKMAAFLESCKFELICSYTYPHVDKEGLRATMDWVRPCPLATKDSLLTIWQHNILWFFDEVTDTETGKDATHSAEVVIRTLRDPEYEDGSSLCRMIKEFRINHLARAGPECRRRFLEHCDVAFPAGAREAELREQGKVLSIEGYRTLRRETSGARTCFDMGEYLAGIDLPQSVYDLEDFRVGYDAALDLIFLANDMYSYNMEQAKGHHGANIVTVVMKEKKCSIQDAIDYIAEMCQERLDEYQKAKASLARRARSENDKVYANALRDGVQALEEYGHWVRGNIEWSFKTERYFGKQNKAVKESLVVVLANPNSTDRKLAQ
ncbi:Anterior gradient protein 2 [Paramarasmius palmivorus]|uniref:Terpene synthase n=1 Tax=Paramarasmius palmivorus TaxID=297713 RepID=A0AAW0C9P2_9AGAR